MTNTAQSPESNERQPVAFDPRTRKVMELRRLVREGRYKPDPAEVAHAILREWTAAEQSETARRAQTFAGRFIVAPAAPAPSGDVALPA